MQLNEHVNNEEWELPPGKVFIAACKHGYIEVRVKGKPMVLGPEEVVMFCSGQSIQNIYTSKGFEGFCLGMSIERLSQKDKLFWAFIEMITSDNVVNRRLSYYAEKLYVTPKYLSHVCRCVSGQTAVAWINQMVTDSIRYDLECSDMTIKEIAAKYDFPNLSFFGKYTKRQLGMSPTEYRRQRERGEMQVKGRDLTFIDM
ncbi:MAG: helix-turn-helix domain-containing protein [Prevotella sp.]